MPGPSGSMLCDDGAAVRIRARAVYVCRCERSAEHGSGGASGAGRSLGLRLPSRHGRKAYLLGSSGGLPLRLGVEGVGSSTYAAAQRIGAD